MAYPVILGNTSDMNNGGPSSTVTPSSTIPVGSWMMVILGSTTGSGSLGLPEHTPPTGWTRIAPFTGTGTLKSTIFAKIKEDSDPTTFTFTNNFAANTVWSIMWGSGSAPVSDWVLGTPTNRPQSGTSTSNIATSVTTTRAESLVIAASMERTSATETALTSIVNATQVYFVPHISTGIQTIAVASMQRPTVGATPAVTFNYPNSQSVNGQSVQIAISPGVVEAPTPVATIASLSNTVIGQLRAGWFTTSATSARMVVSESSAFTNPVYSGALTIASSGATTGAVTGLKQGTQYYVGLEANGTLLATGRASARTLRSSKILSSFKIVAGSCNETGSNAVVFDTMRNENAEFLVHMGDRHYADTSVESTWRAAMKSSITSAKQNALVAATPMEWTPDNHDWGGNRSWRESPVSTFLPGVVRETMGDFAHPSAFYKSWTHNNIRFIHLDRWSLRDKDATGTSTDGDSSAPKADNDPTKVMLGTAQEGWFNTQLQSATEDMIIVFTGFPVSATRFAPYAAETARIRALIDSLPAKQKAKIVAIGGDSHDIRADSGASKSVWGVPTLNASPFDQSGGAFDLTGWDIGIISPVESGRGYYSRLTFSYPSATSTTMLWEAVKDDNTVQMSWSKTVLTTAQVFKDARVGTTQAKAVYVGTTRVWP